eukprot:m.164420 g.164420  ORF g.164420 m.164420 type:complete len:61 (+) comp18111_c0_seq81:1767-1949(+)
MDKEECLCDCQKLIRLRKQTCYDTSLCSYVGDRQFQTTECNVSIRCSSLYPIEISVESKC